MTITALPYTRALHPSDYDTPELRDYVRMVAAFEGRMNLARAPYRKDHQHREWEYANVLRQITELGVTPGAVILDTGSGGNYFAPLLATLGFAITVEDSMAYGDTQAFVVSQCSELGIQLPMLREALEEMPSVADGSVDVATCVSTIEHVGVEHGEYERALHELARITKVGGYVFMTSDYFRNEQQAELSPYKQIQHTRYTKERVLEIPTIEPRLEFVGGIDLDYRGDFVHNYSFVNMAFRRV